MDYQSLITYLESPKPNKVLDSSFSCSFSEEEKQEASIFLKEVKEKIEDEARWSFRYLSLDNFFTAWLREKFSVSQTLLATDALLELRWNRILSGTNPLPEIGASIQNRNRLFGSLFSMRNSFRQHRVTVGFGCAGSAIDRGIRFHHLNPTLDQLQEVLEEWACRVIRKLSCLNIQKCDLEWPIPSEAWLPELGEWFAESAFINQHLEYQMWLETMNRLFYSEYDTPFEFPPEWKNYWQKKFLEGRELRTTTH